MEPSNDDQPNTIKLNLTAKDGRKAKIEGSKEDVLELLSALGFGPSSSDQSKSSVESKETRTHSIRESSSPSHPDLLAMSKIERIKILIRSLSTKPGHWFTSKDILSTYEKFIDEPISLSTVSTYLSRLEDQHILQKRGSKRDLEYSLISHELDSVPQFDFLEKRFISVNKKSK